MSKARDEGFESSFAGRMNSDKSYYELSTSDIQVLREEGSD